MKDVRKRYILYELVSEAQIDLGEFKKTFLDLSLKLLGEIDFKNANLLILETEHKNKGIIRCSHKYVDKVKFTLAMIKEINGQKIIAQSLKTSGTLKSLKG